MSSISYTNTPDQHRLAVAPSNDPFERGAQLGKQLHLLARELHMLLHDVWFGHLAKEWAHIADSSLPLLQQHAPISTGELLGYASVLDETGTSDDGMRILLLLGSERELGMLNAQQAAGFRSPPLGGGGGVSVDDDPSASSPKDCSGIVWSNGQRSLLGHATDLTPEFYLSGKATRVCRLAGGVHEGVTYPSCLTINFAGVGCIGGTNACGLTISRFTVDTGERSLDAGVPIYWLVREALTRPTLQGAVNYLRECPRTLPYAFHLAQGGCVVGVECSPSRFTVVDGGGDEYSGVRANHCQLDLEMIRTEIGAHHLAALGGQDDKSSAARQASLADALAKMTGEGKEGEGEGDKVPSIAGFQNALLTSPVTNETTMFCFVASSRGVEEEEAEEEEEALQPHRLHVQFFGDGPEFHAYDV